MTRYVSAPETAAMLADQQEIAFLDVREIVPFGAGRLDRSRAGYVAADTDSSHYRCG